MVILWQSMPCASAAAHEHHTNQHKTNAERTNTAVSRPSSVRGGNAKKAYCKRQTNTASRQARVPSVGRPLQVRNLSIVRLWCVRACPFLSVVCPYRVRQMIVVAGDCARIFPEAEGRATPWSLEGCVAAVVGGWENIKIQPIGYKLFG